MRLLEREPDGQSIGSVLLEDCSTALGMLAEASFVEGMEDITSYGGRRQCLRSRPQP